MEKAKGFGGTLMKRICSKILCMAFYACLFIAAAPVSTKAQTASGSNIDWINETFPDDPSVLKWWDARQTRMDAEAKEKDITSAADALNKIARAYRLVLIDLKPSN